MFMPMVSWAIGEIGLLKQGCWQCVRSASDPRAIGNWLLEQEWMQHVRACVCVCVLCVWVCVCVCVVCVSVCVCVCVCVWGCVCVIEREGVGYGVCEGVCERKDREKRERENKRERDLYEGIVVFLVILSKIMHFSDKVLHVVNPVHRIPHLHSQSFWLYVDQWYSWEWCYIKNHNHKVTQGLYQCFFWHTYFIYWTIFCTVTLCLCFLAFVFAL